MLDLPRVRAALAGYEPQLVSGAGMSQAAVAMLLRPSTVSAVPFSTTASTLPGPSTASVLPRPSVGAPEVLLIERARRDGDPWSGHMAFPGGRVEGSDESLQRAAERETFEEVGIDLAGAELLGRLDDLQGRHAGRPVGLVVSAFVYHVPDPAPIEASPEVELALWVPVPVLADPAHHVDYPYPLAGGARYPGIVVGDPDRHIVWGLTYRFLEIFFQVVERPLPDRWQGVR